MNERMNGWMNECMKKWMKGDIKTLLYSYTRLTDPMPSKHETDVGAMLVHRLRLWPNIQPTLG